MEVSKMQSGGTEISTRNMMIAGKNNGVGSPEEHIAMEVMLNKRITGIFLMLGMPTKIKGYRYLKESVAIAVKDVNSTDRMRAGVYEKVAEKFGERNAKNVERACSYAVNMANNSGKMENLNGLLGVKVYGSRHEKPSAGEFISLIADRIRLEFIK